MEGIELTAFSIISNVGMAKSLAIEALRDARKESTMKQKENG